MAISVLILRYSDPSRLKGIDLQDINSNSVEMKPLHKDETLDSSVPEEEGPTLGAVFRQLVNYDGLDRPSRLSSRVATSLIVAISKSILVAETLLHSSLLSRFDSHCSLFTFGQIGSTAFQPGMAVLCNSGLSCHPACHSHCFTHPAATITD